jgi:hypothetical protein
LYRYLKTLNILEKKSSYENKKLNALCLNDYVVADKLFLFTI